MKAVRQAKSTAIVKRAVSQLPSGYVELLLDIKTRVRAAQVKASLSVNRELVLLYWDLGKAIVTQQQTAGWGKSVIETLASDLQREFPDRQGFSALNLWRMRAFYLAYTSHSKKLSQAATVSPDPNLSQAATDIIRELNGVNLPPTLADIPWFHNVILIHKIKDPVCRLWYARQTITNGWSRAMLIHQIETRLHTRQGKAITNFRRTLPAPQSDLAEQLFKDPYTFDFLTLAADARERDLEQGLLDHIQRFLVELGVGFAFVGRQFHLAVGGDDYYVDLLFYHLRLRCYVVIDLKTEAFKPEFAGKLNFYLSAVDDQLRHPADKPSIGLLLCKTKQHLTVEYALRDLRKPIGVAAWQTRLVESLPKELKGSLPTIEELEAELSGRKEPRRK